jgi:hypothetical protein
MDRKNTLGITRASMRSSKSMKKAFKNSKALHGNSGKSSTISLTCIQKSNQFKAQKAPSNFQSKTFKDSVKLKKAEIKSKLNIKITQSKQSKNSTICSRSNKNKENKINGALKGNNQTESSLRRPFSNLEIGVF